MAEILGVATLAGREVTFLTPTDAQGVVVRRLMRTLERPNASDEAKENAFISLLDALSYLMDSNESRIHVDTAILSGELTIQEFLNGFIDATQSTEDAPDAPVKATKRAPRKGAKAARARRG